MLQHADDWEVGHTPVTTGRASWLTSPFIQAMHFIRSARAEARFNAQQKARGGHGNR